MRKALQISFFLLLFSFSQAALAQDYSKAIGARLGAPLSVSFKTFISDQAALEFFANFRTRNILSDFRWTRLGLGGAYQVHQDIDLLDGLRWYYGGGISVYYWSYNNDFYFEDADNLSFGLQGYLGLDYKFPDAPVNISLDWVPTYFINGYVSGFGADSGAIAVRYTFSD